MKATVQVPTKLKDLLGFGEDCSCGRRHSVDTGSVSIRHGAVEDIVVNARDVGRDLRICLVADRVTRQIAGEDVFDLLNRDGHKISWCIVPDGPGSRPHATQPNVELVESAIDGVHLVVAVGSGTINDLAKLASFNKNIPYIVVTTAPSMNGYTSAIAAIMRDGLKRTVECHQPQAVIADLNILCKAPLHLVASGFGDLESKPTSTSDYRLSGMLRGTYNCSVPEIVVFAAEKRAAEASCGLAKGDPESITALTEALVMSGISMKLAGSSSPASGGEHLISHHWDMTAEEEGRVEGWHGAQVGVATIVVSALYERLRQLDPNNIDIDAVLARRLSDDLMKKRILSTHGRWGSEAAEEFFKKRLSADDHRLELVRIVNKWDEIWDRLADVFRPAGQVRSLLAGAGASVTVRELGLSAEHLRRSFLVAREIRGRFTVLDFAAELGLLESVCDEVILASGCC